MEGLHLPGINREFRTLEHGRVVERADLDDQLIQPGPARHHMGSAIGAEFKCDRVLQAFGKKSTAEAELQIDGMTISQQIY